jgi:N,N'-diacetyllegionaminate synthase
MKVGNFDTDQKVFVIAEIGNNHEGSLEEAKKMVRAAAEAGANAVKFQTIIPSLLVSSDQTDRINQLGRYAFSREQFLELKKEADRRDVIFLSTPFDLDSVIFLNPLVPAFKIASGDSNFKALLKKVAETGKPVFISTGLSSWAEKELLRDFFHRIWGESGKGVPGLSLLHAVVEYPTADNRAALGHLRELVKMKGVTPGYSDHTIGIEAAVLAVGMGARIIEKHFTLDKTKTSFRDHSISADPFDLKVLVDRIRQAETFLGQPNLQEAPSSALGARRSAAAGKDLQAGHKLGAEDLVWLRPGTGFSPESESQILGRILVRSVRKGILFSKEDFRF